jgi:4-hydroxy-tetrahydrodipicolinate synthase
VIAGTGSNSTTEAIHQTQEAERAGADVCLLVTPYYNKPTQEGLYAHYQKIASETSVPILLYNVPPRTACDMGAETVARLSQIEGILGIKEACGDANRVQEIRNKVSDDFVILSGEDGQTRQMFDFGATGAISVTANVLPREMSEFCQSFLTGDVSRCDELDRALQPVHEILFIEVSPSPTKWVLNQMGKIDGGIRLPLLALSEDKRELVLKRLSDFGVVE